ncbi:23S rRNA pseudouridine(955/2504/2580) synthase RluC [Methylococcus sp. EFPC2]|uniref:23S rRNA pseudouridine(955/2504/2580) synthase RluC n=1 Tax=Methylococcus sp. EFPC2 TaxID=2812648 RepID=UPI00196785C2|nr:23S rRNA pseudouridine(955/2504/2580) synthase RluC [Methylococcus sp. EFPC2]QSA95771.1 23S rRNA pseudouridine(955/2504/2580) synthase RluC [Methylococcus sp. EFPC2]
MNEPSDNKPRLIEIDAESAGQRVDNFLFTRLKGVPKSHVYRILRTGEVRINGGRCQAPRKLEEGDVVRVPPVRTAQREETSAPVGLLRGRLESAIAYEDDDFLVIDKPAGMAVHGGSGVSYGVIEGLRALRPRAKFLELVHRLDRDTSGLLLVAKKRSALNALHALFRDDHAVRKVYVALLAGVWARKQLSVDAPLKKNVLQSGERIVKVARDGKPALTEFRRLRKYATATLVEARLYTGRTHQIRVHAQSMGHPIACDERYGEDAANQAFRRSGLRRLFLHAAELSFIHPRTGQPFTIKAPLAAELQNYLDTLTA